MVSNSVLVIGSINEITTIPPMRIVRPRAYVAGVGGLRIQKHHDVMLAPFSKRLTSETDANEEKKKDVVLLVLNPVSWVETVYCDIVVDAGFWR